MTETHFLVCAFMDIGDEEEICQKTCTLKSLKVSKNTMKNKTVCATKYLKSYN